MGVIYRITCKTSGKKYIGQTKHNAQYRWRQHVWEAKHPKVAQSRKLNRAIIKYGEDDFIIETIMDCELNTLDKFEILYIKNENTVEGGYNLSYGGKYNQEVSQSTKDKLSKALRGKPKNVVWRKREEDVGLPKYLKHYKDSKCEGYKIDSHPKMNNVSVSFTRSDETMEVKLEKALKLLDDVNSGTYVAIKKQEPTGIQLIPNGYRVRIKNKPVKTFQKSSLSMEQKFQRASEYMATIQ
tara:strand:- start:59632 stop:60351 length:720 start_codon:yes stop_codon:yes gene_type:complete